jgi:hypothetical protein
MKNATLRSHRGTHFKTGRTAWRLLAVFSVLPAAASFGMAQAAASSVPATQPSVSAVANANAGGQDDLQQQVRDLQAQLKLTQAREQALENVVRTQPAEPDAAAVSQQLVADADRHSTLLADTSFIAGYDPEKGFQLTSDDGDFRLHPFILLQARDVTNWRDSGNPRGQSDTQNGMEIRRMQLGAEGNMFSPDFTYRIFIQTDRSGGEASLFDAWVKYHFHDTPWYIEAGQFKSPFSHEQMVFDRTLLAADRTLVDDILANGEAFSEGVMAVYDNKDALRAKVDFTNGYGSNDTNFENVPARADNFGIGARGEYKISGKWNDYDQFSSLGNSDGLLVLGAGLDWTEADPADFIRQAVDLQWNRGPLGVYLGYVGRYTAHNSTFGYAFDAGAVAQVSYMLDPHHWELFGRYDYLRLDGKEFTGPTNSNVHELTAGVNYYFYGQNAKLTSDATYLPVGSPVDDNGSGVLLSSGKPEVLIRVQFQLAI